VNEKKSKVNDKKSKREKWEKQQDEEVRWLQRWRCNREGSVQTRWNRKGGVVINRTEDTACSDGEEVDFAGLSYKCFYLSCNSWILALHSSTSDSTVFV
jgi:hypothetical protein